MTEDEFRTVISECGLSVLKDGPNYLEIYLTDAYGSSLPFVLFQKKYTGYGAGERPPGYVSVCPIKPIKTIDGYVVNYETLDNFFNINIRGFSKAVKLKRFLIEQMKLLKELRGKIKVTELSWDFCSEDPEM